MASSTPALTAPSGRARRAASVRDRVALLRDRLLASQRFRDWAASMPVFRGIARRRARALFDLCAGFVYSQVLAAAVRLDLFELLHREGPIPPDDLARRVGLPPARLALLADAAVSLGLLERRSGGRIGLGPLGASMVGNAGAAAMVRHHALLYADLADPVALLREGGADTRLGRFWTYAGAGVARADDAGSGDVADYTELMAASQPLVAGEILDAWDLSRHRALLDLGGGNGTFARAAAARVPGLSVTVLDLPPVAEIAGRRFAEAGLGPRVRAVGGDFVCGRLPRGADIVTLVRILHDHDDAAVRAILANSRAALPPGGTILVAEPMSGTPGAAPVGDAYFGFYLLAMGQGRPRTADELAAFLAEAGFVRPRLLPTRQPLLVRVMIAEVPVRSNSIDMQDCQDRFTAEGEGQEAAAKRGDHVA